jgi:hypothetical protein
MATKKIAFYTMGDTRPVRGWKVLIGGKKRTMLASEMWRLRAQSLAGVGTTYGVATVDSAEVSVQKLEKGAQLTKVYFVGHGFGNNDGGFFFSGRPEGNDDFRATAEKTLSILAETKMKKFAKTLSGALAKGDDVEIAFLSCYTGQGKFTGRFYSELYGHGVKKITVGAYKDYYRTVYKTDAKGSITGWSDVIVDKAKKTILRAGAGGIPPYQVKHKAINLDPDDPLEGL